MSTARRCRRCASPLAQDNTNALCSACEGRCPGGLAPEVPAEFWHTALIGAALASEELGRVLRMYRFHPAHRRPLHQSVLARWLYVSPATLSRIEHGRRHVTIDEIDGFTRALGIPLALRWTTHPSEAREDVDPLSRRSLLGVGVGAAFGFGATTAPAVARAIDPGLVQHWIKLLRLLDHHGAMFGPHSVSDTVHRELGLIAERRQTATSGALRSELLRVESRWSEFAGWLSYDMGDLHGRDAWADRASRLAQEADWPDMVAYMLTRRSHWAAQQRGAASAIGFAEAASRTYGISDEIRAACALKQAQGHALANDAAACERKLADAQRLLDADPAQTPWSDLGRQENTPACVLATNARCWLSLRPSKAIATYEDVLRRWPSNRVRDRGVQQARLALACVAADEPERAAIEGVKALDIALATKSNVAVREIKRLDRQLATCDLPEAAHFREAFAAL